MNNMKTQFIEKRLAQIKKAVELKHYVYWGKRPGNRNFLASRAWSVKDVERVIEGLTIASYHQEPESDRDGSNGEVWKYFHPSSGEIIYIKMKLAHIEEVDFVTVMSFHKEGEH